jgi:hypothetical protein
MSGIFLCITNKSHEKTELLYAHYHMLLLYTCLQIKRKKKRTTHNQRDLLYFHILAFFFPLPNQLAMQTMSFFPLLHFLFLVLSRLHTRQMIIKKTATIFIVILIEDDVSIFCINYICCK